MVDLEQQTQQNTKDIHTLTIQVNKLATIVEFAEKHHESDRQDMRDVVSGLKGLNEKIGALANLQEKIGLMTGEIGKLRHDIKNLENAQSGIPMLRDKLTYNEKGVADHETRLAAIEKWRDRKDGAAGAVNWLLHGFWAVFGSAILAVVGFVLWLFFNHKGGLMIGD